MPETNTDCPPGPTQPLPLLMSSVPPPLVSAVPFLLTKPPVMLVERPTRMLYVLLAPWQQRSHDVKR